MFSCYLVSMVVSDFPQNQKYVHSTFTPGPGPQPPGDEPVSRERVFLNQLTHWKNYSKNGWHLNCSLSASNWPVVYLAERARRTFALGKHTNFLILSPPARPAVKCVKRASLTRRPRHWFVVCRRVRSMSDLMDFMWQPTVWQKMESWRLRVHSIQQEWNTRRSSNELTVKVTS